MTPSILQAGITASWSYALPSHYSNCDFTYILQGPGKIEINATVSGGEIHVNETAAATKQWVPGVYRFQLIAAAGADRHIAQTGTVEIKPDFGDLPANHDFRDHDEKMLDAIKSVLEGRIPKDVESYTIDGRSLARIPIAELMKLKRTYTMAIRNKKRKELGKSSFQPKLVRVNVT